ncbi:PH domain-containing protein [Streptomyces sp. 3MP-14]|uniref:PH domain-containing protein n=1 Tax=Streptomyces mimosae TaxID=2586635 RepID=A0A5N6A3R7_9ACTN|nr:MULTISPECIES: PH domain-containing protein [Streptomyces]KAB8162643.1 PH domain-containing protein [Streptomyces mimosae]KAB8174470.1 PH domain-containing protein [Streptomyces sp. 3MP-14]
MATTNEPTGAPHDERALPLTLRPTLTRVVLLVAGLTVVGVLTLIAVLLPAGGAVSWGLGDRLAIVGSGLLVLAVLALLARPRVSADAEGVTVVNLTTVRRLAWQEIVRVTLRPGDPWVTLDLADGTVLPVMAIQPGVSRERSLADARTLRSLAESLGSARDDR